jgi:pyruvate-formate lyase-activating enzyme
MLTSLRTQFGEYPKLVHGNPEHADALVVNWFMGNTCNYECSYCPTGLHDGSKKWVALEDVKKFVGRVLKHYRDKKRHVFEFTGGEITLYPDFIEMVKFLKENGCTVAIISNGSRSLQFWEKARPYLDQICLSYHPEGAKADHYLSVAHFLSETTRVHLNFMMKPEVFYEVYEVAARSKEIPNISIALQPLIVDFGSELYKYSATQQTLLDKQHSLLTRFVPRTREYEFFRGAMKQVEADGTSVRKEAHRLIANGENSWKGWKCWAGVEQLAVSADGWVFRGWCEEGGTLGHITHKLLSFPKAPVKCSRDYCHCNFDIMSTKVKSRPGIFS